MRETPADHAGANTRMTKKAEAAAVKYRPNFADLAHKFALLGAKDVQIAGFLNVSLGTLMEWQRLYPEFAGMLAQGREQADAEVACALHSRAIGYSHPATKFWLAKTKDSNGGESVEIVEKVYVEHFPPDTKACETWLFNRQPELWRNASHQTVDASVELKVTGISQLLSLVRTTKAASALPEAEVTPVRRAA